jgi:hypothetical protein
MPETPSLLDLLKQACAPDATRVGAPPNPHSQREGPVARVLTAPLKAGAHLLERPDQLALVLGTSALGEGAAAGLLKGVKWAHDVGDVAGATRAELLSKLPDAERKFALSDPTFSKIFKP